MRIFAFLAVLFVCFSGPAQAAKIYNYSSFAQIPILHEGRIKPLDSFARLMLKRFSGENNVEGIAATPWLAHTLFDPASAADTKIFRITERDLKEKLGFESSKQKLFSYADLQESLRITAKEAAALQLQDFNTLSPLGQKLVTLHTNALLYAQLLRSLSLILPLDVYVPKKYRGKDRTQKNWTYLELIKLEQRIKTDLQKIIRRKGEDFMRYSRTEKAIAKLGFRLDTIRSGAQNNMILRIMPVHWAGETPQWMAPWPVLQGGQGSPESAAYLALWKEAATAYRSGEAHEWRDRSKALLASIKKQNPDRVSFPRLAAENAYNIYTPIQFSLAFYAITLLIGVIGVYSKKMQPAPLAFAALAAGVTIHIGGLLMRVYILERPPVATIYESALFVAALCAAAGLLLKWKNDNAVALYAGAGCAAAMLLLSPLLLKEDDGLGVLVAVLNTNFWLATHVIVITAGYAACILAGALAHIHLFAKPSKRLNKTKLSALYKLVTSSSLMALLLTTVGTILGGIWADQSWGRFWGWDPKENGALLIVLWLIWVFHAVRGGRFGENGFLVSIAILNIVVAISWFGVNLLGVGLHSYGFTSGLLGIFVGFCAIEVLLITYLWMKNRAQN